MAQKGVEEMEKRAEAAGSQWRVLALATVGIVVTKMLAAKIAGLWVRKPADDEPK
jgi:hypothetical protein